MTEPSVNSLRDLNYTPWSEVDETESRGPAIPSSVVQITNYDEIVEWIKIRGFVDDDAVITDIQFSADSSGVMRIDDIEVEQ